DNYRAGVSLLSWQIFRPEAAAAKNRHAHHLKVIRRNRTYFGRRFLSQWSRRRPRNVKAAVPLIIIKGTVGADRRGLDSRNIFDAVEQLRPESVLLLIFLVLRIR